MEIVHDIEPVAPGFLVDAGGRPSTDPGVMYRAPQGALLPLGGEAGHKGFGLALVAGMLAGIVAGGGTMADRNVALAGTSNSLFGIVFDPARLRDRAAPLPSLAALIDYLREGDGVAPGGVLMPGAPERAHAMPVDAEVWRALLELSDTIGLSRAPLVSALIDA